MTNVTSYLTFIALLLTSCGTIVPPAPKPRPIAQYSGNVLDSGIGKPQYDKAGTFIGYPINADFVTAYNEYVRDYGIHLFPPQPKPLPTGTTMITAQEKVWWLDLQRQPGLGKNKAGLLQKLGL